MHDRRDRGDEDQMAPRARLVLPDRGAGEPTCSPTGFRGTSPASLSELAGARVAVLCGRRPGYFVT